MEHLSVVLKVPAAALAIPRKFLFIYEVRTCSNRGPILVEPVLRFWFAVLHKISSQVQVQFEVLSQRGMNRTEPNFGNPSNIPIPVACLPHHTWSIFKARQDRKGIDWSSDSGSQLSSILLSHFSPRSLLQSGLWSGFCVLYSLVFDLSIDFQPNGFFCFLQVQVDRKSTRL